MQNKRKTFTKHGKHGTLQLSTVFIYNKRLALTPEAAMTSLTPDQSRAARGFLEWSQAKLAARSNLSESTIRDFEKGRRLPTINNLVAIRHALEAAGVQLTNGDEPGVKLRKIRSKKGK